MQKQNEMLWQPKLFTYLPENKVNICLSPSLSLFLIISLCTQFSQSLSDKNPFTLRHWGIPHVLSEKSLHSN